VTVNIFLRELRGIWEKRNLTGNPVIIAAKHLGLTVLECNEAEERKMLLIELKHIWRRQAFPIDFLILKPLLSNSGYINAKVPG